MLNVANICKLLVHTEPAALQRSGTFGLSVCHRSELRLIKGGVKMYGIHLTGFRQQLVLLEGSVMIIILKIYVIKYHMKILKIILIRIEQNPSLKSVKTVYVTKLLLSG